VQKELAERHDLLIAIHEFLGRSAEWIPHHDRGSTKHFSSGFERS
jgi:hypothetical protein